MLESAIRKIEIWGDSVLKGIIYDPLKKKYTRLEGSQTIASLQGRGLAIRNNAHFGMTAPKARRLMQAALEKGLDCQYAIIEFGGNDCDFHWHEVAGDPDGSHQPNTPLEQFKTCITDMVNDLRRNGITPILVNLPPIEPVRYFSWITRGLDADKILRWLGDVHQIYRFHERYSLAVMNLAAQLHCELIDVREPFLSQKDYGAFLCEDGIHPDKEGHKLMQSVFMDFAESRMLVQY